MHVLTFFGCIRICTCNISVIWRAIAKHSQHLEYGEASLRRAASLSLSPLSLFSFSVSLCLCLSLSRSLSVSVRHLGSSCLFAPLYAHALIALILLFSLCVQALLGTPPLDELGGESTEDCIGLVPWQRLRTSPRTDVREHHGSQPPSMAWICVRCRTESAAHRRKCSNSECRFPGGPPEAWDEKRGKGKRKDKQHVPKHTWHCDGCGEENSSRRWSCSSCGAKPPESEAFSAAAQPKKRPVSERRIFAEAVAQERRRVQAALPIHSPTARWPMSK